jgi:hypothetical protein
MNFCATGVKRFFVGSLMNALPCLARFLALSLRLLFLLLQNIQLFSLAVKPFPPVLFLVVPG